MALSANYYYGSPDGSGQSANYYPLSVRARDRFQTDAAGKATYVFPSAFPAGVMPVIQLAIEAPSGATDTYTATITSLTNLQVVIQVKRSSPAVVALLGLTILQFNSSPQCYVHLVASNPTTPPA